MTSFYLRFSRFWKEVKGKEIDSRSLSRLKQVSKERKEGWVWFCLLWLGFELNSVQYRLRVVIFPFLISKINVCGYNLLQPYERGRTIVYICHIQISAFPVFLIVNRLFTNNFTFLLTIWGVARSSYRLEWHPTSHSALMWRCRRLLRRRPISVLIQFFCFITLWLPSPSWFT